MTSTLLSFHNLISPSSFISFSSSLVAGPFPTIIDSRQQTKSVKMAVPGEMNALHYSKVSVETHGSFIEADCHSPAFCYYNSIYLTPVNAHGFIVPYIVRRGSGIESPCTARGLRHRAPLGDWDTAHRSGIGTPRTARVLGLFQGSEPCEHGKELYSVHST
jgi:hypothetical protein